MISKLQKYTTEWERNTKRIVALQERNAKLEKMIAEQENLELHNLLRGANMSYRELTEYVQSKTEQNTESGTPPETIVEGRREVATEEPERGYPHWEMRAEQEDTGGDEP